VPRLVYLAAARRDIAEISVYIEGESASRVVAEKFIDKLTGYCEQVAGLSGLVGRARPEFGRNYRSTTFGSYPGFNEQVQHLKVAELVHLGGYGKEI
jgi:plasmid stabilization system protein ParE